MNFPKTRDALNSELRLRQASGAMAPDAEVCEVKLAAHVVDAEDSLLVHVTVLFSDSTSVTLNVIEPLNMGTWLRDPIDDAQLSARVH